jgi:hypothetical protein
VDAVLVSGVGGNSYANQFLQLGQASMALTELASQKEINGTATPASRVAAGQVGQKLELETTKNKALSLAADNLQDAADAKRRDPKTYSGFRTFL